LELQVQALTSENRSMKNSKSRARNKKVQKEVELIVIDEKQGLIFEDEKALHGYFEKAIIALEDQYLKIRVKDDFSDKAQIKLEKHLEETLDSPDQIWKVEGTVKDLTVHVFMKDIQVKSQEFTYIAICYVTEEDRIPTFVLTHFPTRDLSTIQHYRSGELIYDKIFEKVVEGALEGDSLLEGDPLAVGLYLSMLKVRSEQDIPQSEFKNYFEMREPTIEDADEIWRKSDLNGNLMVVFIKEFSDHVLPDLTYLTVTIEDEKNGVHTLLFSFPTTDPTLVDRYRMGENLQAEEVTQESSH
jgi:hypothetical protein